MPRKSSYLVVAIALSAATSSSAAQEASAPPSTTSTTELPAVTVTAPKPTSKRPEKKLRLAEPSRSIRLHQPSTTQRNQQAPAVVPEPSASRNPTMTEGTGDYTAEAVTIGSKFPAAPRQIPQSISVISQQQIKEQGLTTLGDAMQQTPGITVVNNNSFMPMFYSRGFQLTTVQQDGIPLEYSNNNAYGPLDLSMYDHVEVLRGPGGLLTGQGLPSGTVNLVRKQAQDQFGISSELTAGSFNFYRAMVDVTGPMNADGTVKGRLVVSGQVNGFYNWDSSNNKNGLVYGTITAALTLDTHLRFGGSFQENNSIPTTGLPAYTTGQLLNVPRSTFIGADWNRRPNEMENPFIELTHQFDNGWTFRSAADYFHQDTDWTRAYPTAGVNPATNTFPAYYAAQTLFLEDQTSTDTSIGGPITLFGRTHQLLFGFNWRQEAYTYTPGALITIPGPFNVYGLSPDISKPASLPIASKTFTDTIQYGAYASSRISLADRLTAILGGRFSWYEASAQTLYPTVLAPTKYGNDGVFTPYAALIYDLTDQLSSYASYTSIFLPQSLRTYNGNLLQPITGDQYEIGLKQSFFNDKLQASVALFLIHENNTAQADNDHPGFYLPSGGKIESKGLELLLTGRLAPGWNITGGYTYNPTKYVRDETYQGQAYSTFTPENIYKLWSNYDVQEGVFQNWSVGFGISGVSKFSSNGITQGAYATVDVRVAYRFSKNVTASLNLYNITDTKYYQTVGALPYNNIYGIPFAARLTLASKF